LWAKPTTEQNFFARIDPKGLVTVNEDAVLKDVGTAYHVCPTYNGGRDWAQGAYNPKTNVMYFPLSNLCIESTARTDRAAAPQFVYKTNVGKFAAGKGRGRPY
jgi:alcohol dehydrogenase (cytochrome c)